MSNHHLRNTETVLKGEGASFPYAVAAGRLGLYHKGAGPYLQGWRGFHYYRPEGAGTARVSHQQRLRYENGQLGDIEYTIHEKPVTA